MCGPLGTQLSEYNVRTALYLPNISMRAGGGVLSRWTQGLVKQLDNKILEKTKAFGRETLFECHFKVNLINEGISAGVGMGLPKERYILFIFSNKPPGGKYLKIYCDM